MPLPIWKKARLEELWLDEDTQTTWWPQFQEWRKQGNNHGKTTVSYADEWARENLDRPTGVFAANYDGSWAEIERKFPETNRFSLRLELDDPGTISNKFIHSLEISRTGRISLINCVIKVLELRQDQPRDLRLENCKIGTLRLRTSSVGTLEIIGCSVRTIYAPTPSQDSPFTGSVEIRNLTFRQHLKTLRHIEIYGIIWPLYIITKLRRCFMRRRCAQKSEGRA